MSTWRRRADIPHDRGPSLRAIRLASFATFVAAAILIAWRLGYFELGSRERIAAMVARIEDTWWAAPVFSLCYALAVSLILPTTVLTVFAGALFGAAEGAALSWIGAMLGTLAAHALAGIFLGSAVGRIVPVEMVARLKERADVPALMRWRVLPIAPFGVLDYVAGFLGVPLRDLVIATAIAILPSAVAYAYVGDRLIETISDGTTATNAMLTAGAVTVIVCLMSLLPWLVRRLRLRANPSRER